MTLSTRGLVLNGAGERSATPRRLVAVVLALGMLTGCARGDDQGPAPSVTATHETPPGSPEEYAAALVEETNQARTALGLPALSVSACATEQGAVRARALADAGDALEHAPLGPVTQACHPATMAGENLSRASLGPDAVVDAWMGSPGHRENIVTPEFTEVGVACVVSDGAGGEQMLCAQIFLGMLMPG